MHTTIVSARQTGHPAARSAILAVHSFHRSVRVHMAPKRNLQTYFATVVGDTASADADSDAAEAVITLQLRFDYDTTTIRRYHDAVDYDGSDRN